MFQEHKIWQFYDSFCCNRANFLSHLGTAVNYRKKIILFIGLGWAMSTGMNFLSFYVVTLWGQDVAELSWPRYDII